MFSEQATTVDRKGIIIMATTTIRIHVETEAAKAVAAASLEERRTDVDTQNRLLTLPQRSVV